MEQCNSTFISISKTDSSAEYSKAEMHSHITRDIAGSVPWRKTMKKTETRVGMLLQRDRFWERELGEHTLLSRAFQIFRAMYVKLRPKCLLDLYTGETKCGTSSTTSSA